MISTLVITYLPPDRTQADHECLLDGTASLNSARDLSVGPTLLTRPTKVFTKSSMLKQVASFTVDHTRSIDGEAPKEVARQAKRSPNGKSRMNSPELNVDIRHANRGDPDPEYYSLLLCQSSQSIQGATHDTDGRALVVIDIGTTTSPRRREPGGAMHS